MLRKFYILTFSGESLGLALKLQDEGKEVVWGQIQDCRDILTDEEKHVPEDPEEKKSRRALGEGMVNKVTAEQFVKMLAKEDRKTTFFMADFNHCFKWAEKIEPLGFPGNYPTEEDRKLEADREDGKGIVEK